MSVKTTGLNNKEQSKFDIIQQNCESVIALVKVIVSKKPINPVKKGKKSLTQTVMQIIKSFDSLSFEKCREILHKSYTGFMLK